MKVAISCDDLLVRDHYTEIVETVAMAFEEAEVYTLAHRPKAMLGTIELRKIRSTYLSHNIQEREKLAVGSQDPPRDDHGNHPERGGRGASGYRAYSFLSATGA